MKRTSTRHGYILFECLVALSVLSLGALFINRSLYQVMFARALARDYTAARFLLEQLIAAPHLHYWSGPLEEHGRGEGDLSRFEWIRKIEEVPLAPFAAVGDDQKDVQETLIRKGLFLGKVTVTVKWTRADRPFERTICTLIPPGRFWGPEGSTTSSLAFEEGEGQDETEPTP